MRGFFYLLWENSIQKSGRYDPDFLFYDKFSFFYVNYLLAFPLFQEAVCGELQCRYK